MFTPTGAATGVSTGTHRAHQAMLAVGVTEIVAGIAVAVVPHYGALVVAAWLAGIIVNLVSMGQFFDVALRDFGLMAGALALFLLAPAPGRSEK